MHDALVLSLCNLMCTTFFKFIHSRTSPRKMDKKYSRVSQYFKVLLANSNSTLQIKAFKMYNNGYNYPYCALLS